MNYRYLIPLALIPIFILIFIISGSEEKVATVRMDDVQDYWLNDAQEEIIKIHLKYKVPISLGIIAGKFGDDPRVVVKKLLEKKLGEILNHSWDHEEMKGLPYERQEELMRAANHRISRVLGVEPEIFVPPAWSYDEATQRACRELGMRCLTRFEHSVLVPEWDFEAGGWKKFDAEEAIHKIEETHRLHGKVEVYVHFQGIDDLEGYEKLVKWLSDNYGVIKLSEFVQYS